MKLETKKYYTIIVNVFTQLRDSYHEKELFNILKLTNTEQHTILIQEKVEKVHLTPKILI